jgi:hypothetical protein
MIFSLGKKWLVGILEKVEQTFARSNQKQKFDYASKGNSIGC